MTRTSSSLPSDAVAEKSGDYFASQTHYLSLANRIVAALGADRSVILVTGDPPAEPQLLSNALRKVASTRHAVIDIACGAELSAAELSQAGTIVAALPASVGATALSEPAPPLFVLDDVDQLSDEQLREFFEAIRGNPRRSAAIVLLARSGFVTRLADPSLQLLKEGLTARFGFQDIGQDEGIEFLRHQLALRHPRNESRGVPPGLLRGLAASGGFLAVAVCAFLFVQYYYLAGEPASRPARRTSTQPAAAARITPTEPALTGRSAAETASISLGAQSAAPQATQSSQAGSLPPTLEPQGPRPSPADTTALVFRGDDFLRAGDIASARLFYERAAEAGNGAAALRLGATFDPGVLDRAGIRGIPGDPAQAASWYRRARELGDAASAERLNGLDQQRPVEPNPPAR